MSCETGDFLLRVLRALGFDVGSPQTVTAIESLGVGAQEPLHACAQVAARRFHNQMKMIIHQTIGVNLPPGPPTGLVQQIQK